MAKGQGGIILEHIRKLVAAQRRDELPDQQLLQRFAGQRDEAAFTTLVRRHGPMVLRVCRRVLHNWQDAEDAFQATFLTLARKADSIRKQESVGCWLHGVAYRLALQVNADVRRHARSARAAEWSPDHAPAPGPTEDPADEVTWRELRAVLDEELNRLPVKYRAPLLLCYLEGQTRDEAANQLGCPLGTLKSRLERGRELMRSRLARRGLTLSAALLATGLSQSASSAMLPATLVHSTVHAALLFAAGETAAAGVISAHIASLVKGGLQAMGVSKLKVGVALLLASVVLTGAGALAHRALAVKQPDAQQDIAPRTLRIAAEQLAPKGQADKPQQTAQKDTNESFVCSGQVLDPAGKPFAGANVYLDPHSVVKGDLPVRATTGADGRFEFTVSPSKDTNPSTHPRMRGFTVVAAAAGYGPDWASGEDSAALGNLNLRLVKDDVPIQGRLLTQEGKPIAGAKVSVRSLQALPGEDLTPYIQAVQDGKFYAFNQDNPRGPSKLLHGDFPWQAPSVIPGLHNSVLTDAGGRFLLTGLGRERVVELNIAGTGIQSWYLTAMTRAVQAVVGPNPVPLGESVTVYGATFEHLIPPGRNIKGVVRDKKTGQPLARIWVAGRGTNAQVRTDDKGRYELPGCPKAKEYAVMADPDPGAMYFVSSATLPDQAGLEPINADLHWCADQESPMPHRACTVSSAGRNLHARPKCRGLLEGTGDNVIGGLSTPPPARGKWQRWQL